MNRYPNPPDRTGAHPLHLRGPQRRDALPDQHRHPAGTAGDGGASRASRLHPQTVGWLRRFLWLTACTAVVVGGALVVVHVLRVMLPLLAAVLILRFLLRHL